MNSFLQVEEGEDPQGTQRKESRTERLTMSQEAAGGAAPIALILFGPPGSGKGTQAKMLKDALRIPHISTGDMLRARIASGDPLGRQVQGLMQSGRLVPDDVVNRLVEERIAQPDCAGGFILDGYPRTIPQAEVVGSALAGQGYAEVVIHLKVDYTVIIARITGRRQCPVCGSLYSLTSHPPKVADICDLDGAHLVVRDDDRESVVRERLEAYERQTRPLLEYFAASGHPFYELDGSHEAPQAILTRIRGLLAVE